MKFFKGLTWGLFLSIILWCLIILAFGCGTDESKVIYEKPLPPPIPPITRPLPQPPTQKPEPKLSHNDFLTQIRNTYRHITFREMVGSNAMARYEYGRPVVYIGTSLKATLSPEAYMQVILHEVAHFRQGQLTKESYADYMSIIYMRNMLRMMHRRHDRHTLRRIARENTRRLRRGRKRYDGVHPPNACRDQIYDAAIDNRGMPACARGYYL